MNIHVYVSRNKSTQFEYCCIKSDACKRFIFLIVKEMIRHIFVDVFDQRFENTFDEKQTEYIIRLTENIRR